MLIHQNTTYIQIDILAGVIKLQAITFIANTLQL